MHLKSPQHKKRKGAMLPFRDFLKTGCPDYTVQMRLPIMPQFNPAKPAFFIPSLDIGPPPLDC